jgi:inosine/xanthosine triphosphate pyrophosphatase family protein
MTMKLVTSNKFKLAEFKRFGLELKIAEGLDLEEVDGTPLEVVTYKALAAGEDNMVEDTILIIDGVEVVDIRERIAELNDLIGKDAIWKVSIACVVGDELHTCSAEIKGYINVPLTNPDDCFGFDAFFFPKINNSKGYSLHQLEMAGKKDDFSARKNCITDFLKHDNNFESKLINSIPKWKGGYQNISH